MKWHVTWLFPLLLVGCLSGGGDSSDGTDGSDGSNGTDGSNGSDQPGETGGDGDGVTSGVGTLEDECAAYCAVQGGCPNDPLPGECFDSCVGLGEMFPECESIWNRLNNCMANDTLECDPTGNSATSNPDCLEIVTEYGDCLSAP